MKNEAIAPGWMDKGSQVTFELAHPAAAMRHTVSNGYLVLSARRVKPVEKKRAQRNHSRPIWRIAKGSLWGAPEPYNKAPSMLFASLQGIDFRPDKVIDDGGDYKENDTCDVIGHEQLSGFLFHERKKAHFGGEEIPA